MYPENFIGIGSPNMKLIYLNCRFLAIFAVIPKVRRTMAKVRQKLVWTDKIF